MIPTTIHYCWFGGNPLPDLALKCIESWKRYLPDYEIKEWNETNFDIGIIPYTREAYTAKKYAFVSDYARFWILYHEGGLYFDTDVEIIKPMDDIIASGPFMGCEKPYKVGATPNELGIAPGLGLGVNPGLGLYKEIIDYYSTLHFLNKDGSLNTETVVKYTTDILCNHGLRNTPEIQEICGILIYPKKYFCPIDYKTGKMEISDDTVSIHHYAESWHGKKEKIYKKAEKILGFKIAHILSLIWNAFNHKKKNSSK